MAMSLPSSDRTRTPAQGRVAQPILTRRNTGGLDDTPAGATDRDALLEHLGRNVIHASVDRQFSKAYRRDEDGVSCPMYYRVTSAAFARCQYVMLTTKQYAAVLVVDIDRPGSPGGHPADLALDVRQNLAMLVQCGIGPSWVGINPINGKAQAIWLIDPVYADATGQSRNMTLLSATSRALGELLDHDPHFSHRFSRSPFYTGNDPTAYRWYCQHKRVHRLADLLKEVRAMMGTSSHETAPRQQFTSGRELINAVKTRREEAQAFKALAQDVEKELGDELDQYDPELIDGVRVLWISQGKAARDETAFRHALKTGHRLRAAGQRMTDAAIIDAYEHAYNVAHRHGADGRDNEMPPMRDRQTMARRVRGYVTQSKANTGHAASAQRATTTERKALATMGRRGGQKAAQRWKTDPEGEYAQGRRETLKAANQRRTIQGRGTRARVLHVAMDTLAQTGKLPSGREIAAELGVTKRTVNMHLRALREAGMLD
ncbi:replication initiation protein [Corynebacterium uropygiale]|uniref:Replication initiation protein n=2 Tax=Corynebacterium uropygiale TaxID=1775911 RepID=A0A9X1U1M8_9CORY|nr:replication initiation protein [Corynebacterium uropygiale]MCF4007773.1 replication initiation protein [Corynebacterium uropygiale]